MPERKHKLMFGAAEAAQDDAQLVAKRGDAAGIGVLEQDASAHVPGEGGIVESAWSATSHVTLAECGGCTGRAWAHGASCEVVSAPLQVGFLRREQAAAL